MSAFLARVAQDLVEKHQDLRNLAIVLPSRRSAVFLKEELSKCITKPVWSPGIMTGEDLVLRGLDWELADQPTLIFKLYESYSAVVPEPRESFSEFSHWAQLLLADFNEVDRYLVDYQQLFEYLADVERIKKWDLQGGEVTELIANYLKLWESLPGIYRHFTEGLRKEAMVYQGMAYREFAARVDEVSGKLAFRYNKVAFVGFNALNKSESRIMMHLYKEGLASFYWDVDSYYLNDPRQEAGLFLRKDPLVKQLLEAGEFNWISDDLAATNKQIKLIAANGDHQQAVIANKLIESADPEGQLDTALVLAEERLLPSFLNNLSASTSSLNITMGLPLNETSMAGFFQLIISMLRDQEQHQRKDADGNPAFHHRYWGDLLGNNLMPLWVADAGNLHELQYQIVRRNRIYLSTEELDSWFPGVLGTDLMNFFGEITRGDMAESWLQLAGLASHLYQGSQGRISLPQPFYGFYRIFNRLSDLMRDYPYVADWQTALRFYRELISSETLDLKGDPLSGIQVMGMLETRTLDFRKLIITSLNEDVLPKGRSENSLIPFEIRTEFGLPTYLDKDAVYAYHFYRLLQRAEDITLIYNSASSGLHTGEPSRFIRQLQFELDRQDNVEITPISWNFEVIQQDEETITKTPAVMKDLQALAKKGLSPTALIDYINDQTEFYRKRVLNLKEVDEVEEVAGYDTQGNVVHGMLEEYYLDVATNDSGSRFLSPDLPVYSLGRAELTTAVEERLAEESGHRDFTSGKNLIIREILASMIQRFLKAERAELRNIASSGSSLELLGLEENYSWEIVLGNGTKVRIHGNIDRIDKVSGEVRIIDYKTGSVEDKNLQIKVWEDLRQPKEANKSLQLMMYAWLYMRNHPDLECVKAGIISLRKTNKWLMPLKVSAQMEISREILDDFEGFLRQLLEEIFDPGLAFEKNPVTLQSDE